MTAIYNTSITIPSADILTTAVDGYFGTDDYAREKIGNPIVNQLAGKTLTLYTLIASLKAIKNSESAAALVQANAMIPSSYDELSPYSLLAIFCDRAMITKLWKVEHPNLDTQAIQFIPIMVDQTLNKDVDFIHRIKVEKMLNDFGPYVAEELEKRWKNHPTDDTLSNYCSGLANLSMGYASYGNFVPGILAIFRDHRIKLDWHGAWRMMVVLTKYRDIQQLDPQQEGLIYAFEECQLASPLTWGGANRNQRSDNAHAALSVIANYDLKDNQSFKQQLIDLIPVDGKYGGSNHYGNGYARQIVRIIVNSDSHSILKDEEQYKSLQYTHPSFHIEVRWFDWSKKWSIRMVSDGSIGSF